MATKSVYDWRRNDVNEGAWSEIDRSHCTGETRVDDGRAGDVLWTWDVEEVGVWLRFDDDCAGDV